MSPQARFQKPTIQKILEAAEAVFAEEGFAVARVDDVAARAGVAKSHLYYHFASKDELLSELVQWRTAQMLAEKEALLGELTELTPEVVQHFIRNALLNILAKRRNFVRVALMEGIASDQPTSPLFQMVQVLLGDTLKRFETLGFTVDPQEFISTFYYFGLLPVAMHIAIGDRWATVNGIPPEQNDEWFMRMLAQLENTFIEQLKGGSS